MRYSPGALIAIILLAIITIYIVLPIEHVSWLEDAASFGLEESRDLKDLKLGLDLQGGTQVLLESDLADGQNPESGAMDAAKLTVENRVNGLGVAEAVVQVQGENRMIVELPGVSDPDRAVETIRATGLLEFIDLAGVDLPRELIEAGVIINTTNRPRAASDVEEAFADDDTGRTLLPFMAGRVFETAMTGTILRNAVAAADQFAQWQINFELTGEGSDAFFEYTRNNVGRPLAIVLDGRVLSAPIINQAIRDSGVISGNFSQQEAEGLAVQMRYGSLPVPLKVIDIRTIGASLGQDSVDRSLQAGIIGMSAVLLFMLLLYRLPGLLADVALVLYILLNIAIFKLMPVTLTLPGIAGFILSIGMAVDANILIFERLKEELRMGRSVRLAVEAGFSRAWPAIRDGNLSTLISCAVLFWFGNTFGASIVKGFAVTLGIGVLLSMFTAVFITRTFMRTFLSMGSQKLSNARNLLGY